LDRPSGQCTLTQTKTILKCDYWKGGDCSVSDNKYADFVDFVLGADKDKAKKNKRE
jgi:hypothetical protein